MTQPGDASQPEDTRGDGPVELPDRTAPGGQGSPDTNQAKAEPEPAAEHEADPRAPREAPDLASMNVGAADPQRASHPAAGRRPTHGALPGSEDVARAAPTDPTEHQGTDVDEGAAHMGSGAPSAEPGDAGGVVVPSKESAEGTSEEQGGVGGIRP